MDYFRSFMTGVFLWVCFISAHHWWIFNRAWILFWFVK